MPREYFVYILTNKDNSTLYIGVTNDIQRRMSEHKEKSITGFSAKYNLGKLVYYEITNDVISAIKREKQLKSWKRVWKYALVNKHNPEWKDLSEELF